MLHCLAMAPVDRRTSALLEGDWEEWWGGGGGGGESEKLYCNRVYQVVGTELHCAGVSPLREALNRRYDENRGYDGVEESVAQCHQIHYHPNGQDREQVGRHRLPEVKEEILHLGYGEE